MYSLSPAESWEPQSRHYGLIPMLAASVLVSMLALVIAAPLAILSAAWLRLFTKPGWAALVRAVLELMAGVPSVVYGLWALLVVVPLINRIAPPGASWLASSLVLTAMIAPLALLMADAAFTRFPVEQSSAAEALGISRWGLWRRLMLPHAARAVASGVVLQFGRALGETMAVVMVAGNVVQWPHSLLAPVRTLTGNIALEMSYATGEHLSALFASGLLLMVLTGTLLFLAGRLRGS